MFPALDVVIDNGLWLGSPSIVPMLDGAIAGAKLALERVSAKPIVGAAVTLETAWAVPSASERLLLVLGDIKLLIWPRRDAVICKRLCTFTVEPSAEQSA